MTLPDFIFRFDGFSAFLVNALITMFTANLYHNGRKRYFLLISIASAVGAVLVVLPQMRDSGPSVGAWYFEMVLRIASSGVWLIGFWLLFQDCSRSITLSPQPCATSGEAVPAPVDNSTAPPGPPSVS
jgi:hypothetical protein